MKKSINERDFGKCFYCAIYLLYLIDIHINSHVL
jgi:hypothetical protein